MDIHSNNVSGPVRSAVAPTAPDAQGFDIVRVLWRWKFLPILGALIGMALGYLYYTRQPPQYIATALVQVVSPILPNSNSRMQAFNPDEAMQVSRQDESMVISSERVLRMAAEKIAASDNASVKGMSPPDIAAWVAAGRRLSVTPGAKEASTTLINISFVCEDQELSSIVVNAIVDGYSDYLSEEYRTVGQEIYKLMMEAQDKVAKSYAELRKKRDESREKIDMPLVWTSEGAVNPFANNLQELNARLSALATERSLLESKLSHAERARDGHRDADAILMWLSNSEVVDQPTPFAANDPLGYNLATQQLESERMERSDLFRLRMEEKQYLNTVGENHPVLASIRQQIELVQQQIAKRPEAERAQAAQLAETLSHKKKQAGEKAVF
ncbi:MAG: Wzz/FepE/Etk N-terminal domain-containing protein, partial [Aureliella sp.]